MFVFKQLVAKAIEPIIQINFTNYSFDDAWNELIDLANKKYRETEEVKAANFNP